MSTVKITALPSINTINANTANTILVGVDVPSGVTGKMTLTTLARGLYSNNTLTVGNNFTVLPNVIAQFTGQSQNYIQVNMQNLDANGSSDLVITADTGTDTDHYIDVGLNNSDYNFPGYTFAQPLDGYLVVQGSNTTPSNPGGNLVIGTTTTGKSIDILQGSTTRDGVVAQFLYDTGFKLIKKPLIFADGTSQNTAVDYATINSRITSNATTQNTFTQAAFNKANNALANANVTLAGSIVVTGDITTNGTFHMHNYNITGNTAFLELIASASGATQPPSNPGYALHATGIDGESIRIVGDSFSNTATNYSAFIGRRARGTAAAPLAVQTGDIIARFAGNAYGTTKFSQFGDGRIEVVAAGNHTDASKPTRIDFLTTPAGSNTAQTIASFNGDTATFSGVVSPTKGFIFTPRVLPGAQTAITIDYSADSVIRAAFNSTLTLSHTNYTAGKIVNVWLTNTAGNGQTVNFGTLANNSTTGATSLSVAAGRSAKLEFFSIDGDNANTFVSVIYA